VRKKFDWLKPYCKMFAVGLLLFGGRGGGSVAVVKK